MIILKKLFTFTIIVVLALTGCSASKLSIHDKIHQRFYNLPSYSASCNVTITSNKTKNTYKVNALYDCQSGRYRLDYDKFAIILGNGNAQIVNDGKVTSAPVESSNMLMLINRFFESYYVAESSSIKTNAAISGDTLLECDIINPPAFASNMKLWINSKTILPTKMGVYDKDGNEKIFVEFTEFKILNKVDESIFKY